MKNKKFGSVAAKRFDETLEVLTKSKTLTENISLASQKIIACFKKNHKLLIAGNGGSAADAQHISAELVGKFYSFDRIALPVIALTTNTSIITAIGNDFSFDKTITRQVEALGKKGDILLCISTSGNSKNTIEAAKLAKKMGIYVVSLTGETGGEIKKISDLTVKVPSQNTPIIQNCHTVIYHIICELVESQFLKK